MIPKFKEYFYPFLLALEQNGKKIREIREYIANYFHLTPEDLAELTGGGNSKHNDRTAWTASYLKKMKLVNCEKKGTYAITELGKTVLLDYGKDFSLSVLRDMKGYENTQRKESSNKTHWVEGHYRKDGTYVAGYASNFFAQGIRKKK